MWHVCLKVVYKKKQTILYDAFSTFNILFPQMLIPAISDFVILELKEIPTLLRQKAERQKTAPLKKKRPFRR